MHEPTSRRSFLKSAAFGAAALGTVAAAQSAEPPKIQGFEQEKPAPQAAAKWEPVSDRKIRMGIVGFGVCRFGAQFSLQDHPNVEVVAVSDLFPDRCQALAQACRCQKTYASLEEMVKDESIEAIFLATDAPSHCRHAILVLEHGKHVSSAVPAVFGSVEEADQLFEAVKRSGLIYMLFETSCYHAEVHAMREIYKAGGFGQMVYSEGEYFHYAVSSIDSYKGWRIGLPPQWYPTHSNAYYVGVTGGSFTEVSCMGMPSILEPLRPENNRYKNPFGTEIALFRTSEGGMARMGVSWDTAGYGGEVGRVRGQRGSMVGMNYDGLEKKLPNLARPPLPPSVQPGGHGGSHGYLGHEFVMAILENRKPLVDIAWALNMTVAGVVAHQSALKNGELLKIPQYKV
jgi:predicted dehydrogenase